MKVTAFRRMLTVEPTWVSHEPKSMTKIVLHKLATAPHSRDNDHLTFLPTKRFRTRQRSLEKRNPNLPLELLHRANLDAIRNGTESSPKFEALRMVRSDDTDIFVRYKWSFISFYVSKAGKTTDW